MIKYRIKFSFFINYNEYILNLWKSFRISFVTSTNRQTVFANTLSSVTFLQPFSLILNTKWTCKRMSPKFYKITQLLKLTISFKCLHYTNFNFRQIVCQLHSLFWNVYSLLYKQECVKKGSYFPFLLKLQTTNSFHPEFKIKTNFREGW